VDNADGTVIELEPVEEAATRPRRRPRGWLVAGVLVGSLLLLGGVAEVKAGEAALAWTTQAGARQALVASGETLYLAPVDGGPGLTAVDPRTGAAESRNPVMVRVRMIGCRQMNFSPTVISLRTLVAGDRVAPSNDVRMRLMRMAETT
jgi:hypothetical protein